MQTLKQFLMQNEKNLEKNMIDIGLDLPKSSVNNINQASKVLNKIGLPAIIRPAFTPEDLEVELRN